MGSAGTSHSSGNLTEKGGGGLKRTRLLDESTQSKKKSRDYQWMRQPQKEKMAPSGPCRDQTKKNRKIPDPGEGGKKKAAIKSRSAPGTRKSVLKE